MLTPLPPSYKPPINCLVQAEIDAKQPHPDKKKIFVFCDGTGNEFAQTREQENANSNVVKLYTALRVTNEQVAYYHPGVGTMGNPAIQNAVLRFWSKVKGLAFGAGFRDNVLDAYRYLMETYNDGDEIYCSGSRADRTRLARWRGCCMVTGCYAGGTKATSCMRGRCFVRTWRTAARS